MIQNTSNSSSRENDSKYVPSCIHWFTKKLRHACENNPISGYRSLIRRIRCCRCRSDALHICSSEKGRINGRLVSSHLVIVKIETIHRLPTLFALVGLLLALFTTPDASKTCTGPAHSPNSPITAMKLIVTGATGAGQSFVEVDGGSRVVITTTPMDSRSGHPAHRPRGPLHLRSDGPHTKSPPTHDPGFREADSRDPHKL